MPRCPCCGNDTNKTQFEIDKKDYSKIMLYDKNGKPVSFGDFYKKAVERACIVPRGNDAFIISPEHASKVSINVGSGRMLKVSGLVEKFIRMEARKNKDEEIMLSMHRIIVKEKMSKQNLQRQMIYYQQKLQKKRENISVLKMELDELQTLLERQKATIADQRRQIDELQREVFDKEKIIRDKETQEIKLQTLLERQKAMMADQRRQIDELQREVFDKEKIIRDKETQEIFNRIDSLQNRLKVGKNSIGNKKLSINLGHGEHKKDVPDGKNTHEKIKYLLNDIQNKINNCKRPIVSNNENNRYDRNDVGEISGSQASIALTEADKMKNIDFGDLDQFLAI